MKEFERSYLQEANEGGHEIAETSEALSISTVKLAGGSSIVSIFAGDDASGPVIEALYDEGVRFIAIRAAGFDNVDIQKADKLGIRITNVPEYSPYAIAEHAVALILALNRKLIRGAQQVQRNDFRVDKLVGFDLRGKTIGIIGTGRVGSVFVKIMNGFGCRILGYDKQEDKSLTELYGLEYVTLTALCREADIISLHTSLTQQTRHMISGELIGLMKPGVMLINTSRGGCVNTADILNALESGHVGYYGADVYENERGIFFYDRSDAILADEQLKKLISMHNVLITPHQAFATTEALTNIAMTTFHNIDCWAMGILSGNELTRIEDRRIHSVYQQKK